MYKQEDIISEYYGKSSVNGADYSAIVSLNKEGIEPYSVKFQITDSDGNNEFTARIPFDYIDEAEDTAEDFILFTVSAE